jgi:hypothetical protein
MGVEEGAEEAGGAEKGVEVSETFKVGLSYIEEELSWERQKRGLAFCCAERTHPVSVFSDTMSVELL